MDPELLSRIQFAFTASFHFIFPPLSMGLGLMLLVVSGAYLRTKDPKWRRLAFFWTKVYGLIFALGVATGVVQEFEFGMNWADYSRFVGNVFGSLLAAEGVFAFFLEGGFLGLMLFGGNRLGPRLWFFATLMVVVGAHFSALWIIMANSWMQTPQGFEVVTDPAPVRAVMTDFGQVVFTPSFLPRILHVFIASWTAGSALMLSVSAWYVLRGRHLDLAKSNFSLVLPFFIVLTISNVVLFGANQAIEVTHQQPLKLASMEGLWQGTTCAPLYLFGWVDTATQTTHGVSIPCLLSVLAYFNPQAYVQGLITSCEGPERGDPAHEPSRWCIVALDRCDAAKHARNSDPLRQRVARGQGIGPASGQPDHSEAIDAQMIGDLGEVVGEVVERAVAVGRRPADARAVDPDDPDVELFGEVPSGLRHLLPGARGAVQPHERAAVSRAELREPSRRTRSSHRDGPLDPRGCDGLAGRSVLGGHVISLRRVHDPAQRRRSRGRPIRRLHVAQRARLRE